MAKIALDAGHGLYTPGKRCLKKIDPKETREWTLNSRIAKYVDAHLKRCGIVTMRVDDTTGKTDVSLSSRVNKANNWGADLYLSIHANAGLNGRKGGGIANYSYPGSSRSAKLRDALYKYMIAETGLKGNRSNPCTTANFYVIRKTNMAACLMECGFMDSLDDTPIILTDDFARKCALGIAKGTCEYLGVKFVDGNVSSNNDTSTPTTNKPVTQPAPSKPSKPAIEKLKVDGSWGCDTTKATQKFFGTTVDGIVSRQPINNKKYLPNAYTGSWKFTKSYKGGSAMVKALQRHIGATDDGYFGKNSVTALQRFLKDKGYNLTVDGYMGKNTVMAWQRYLNSKL